MVQFIINNWNLFKTDLIHSIELSTRFRLEHTSPKEQNESRDKLGKNGLEPLVKEVKPFVRWCLTMIFRDSEAMSWFSQYIIHVIVHLTQPSCLLSAFIQVYNFKKKIGTSKMKFLSLYFIISHSHAHSWHCRSS